MNTDREEWHCHNTNKDQNCFDHACPYRSSITIALPCLGCRKEYKLCAACSVGITQSRCFAPHRMTSRKIEKPSFAWPGRCDTCPYVLPKSRPVGRLSRRMESGRSRSSLHCDQLSH